MIIEYDPFVLRQMKPNFKGTNLSKCNPEKLLDYINYQYRDACNIHINLKIERPLIIDSSWDFCKYLVYKNNIPEIKAQVMKLDLNLYPFIRSAYSSRTPEELPVLSRWVELPPGFELPTANYVVCVLYSREQLQKEFDSKNGKGDIQVPTSPRQKPMFYNDKKDFYLSEDCEYGIVSIMGTTNPEPDPLVPVTILRNSLGLSEGGNGEKINRDVYSKSVEFWNSHIMVS